MTVINDWTHSDLVDELSHIQELASLILPRCEKFPSLGNIDYFAAIEPLKGSVSGDHLIILNFAEYNLPEKITEAEAAGNPDLAAKLSTITDRFGILIADAAGHSISDSMTTTYLHAAFKTGVSYELARHGEVTAGLFELLNNMFYNRMTPAFLASKPFVTLIYGEVFDSGKFRFLSAGHPPPIIFSKKYGKIVTLGDTNTISSTPLGILPSKFHVDIGNFAPSALAKDSYAINEINLLGSGDIMLLYTDGLLDHSKGDLMFCDERLEQVLRESQRGTAEEIYLAIKHAMHSFAPASDDITFCVIKKS